MRYFANNEAATSLRQAIQTAPLGMRNTDAWGDQKTQNGMIQAAIVATRRVLSGLPFPTAPDIRYASLRTASVNEGKQAAVIMLTASFNTLSGVRCNIEIPVMHHDGQIVDPSVFLSDGQMRVIAPSSVQDMVRSGTFQQNVEMGHQYSSPPTGQQSRNIYDSLREHMTRPRTNKHMYSIAERRAAIEGQAALDAFYRRAQMTDAVKLLDEWALPAPQSDEEMQKILDRLTQEHNIDPIDALEACDIVFELWHKTSQRIAHNMPPAIGDVLLQLLPTTTEGDRVHTQVAFSPDQSPRMSDGYLKQVASTYLKSQMIPRGLGFIADIRIEDIDRDACVVSLSFVTSKTSAPQLEGPTLRLAAKAPEQDKTDLAPAERKDDYSKAPSLGDTVALTKEFAVTSRGGLVSYFPKGATGRVVKDVYGDGLMLHVQLENATVQVPRAMVKSAAMSTTASGNPEDAVVACIRELRDAGYMPIDAIMTARQRFASDQVEPGLKRAKGLGLLLDPLHRPIWMLYHAYMHKHGKDLVVPDEVRSGKFILVVSLSGGKDSLATALALKEAGVENVRYVFSDTGWEHDLTMTYLDYLEAKLGHIDRVKSHRTFLEWANHYRMFPARTSRYCTEQLKLLPILAYHNKLRDEEGETISVVGIRHDESEARKDAKAFELDSKWNGYIWRPIVDWTVEDVLMVHHRHGFEINPLYKMGHNRVGCYPCIFSAREEIALVADNAPDRIDLIRKEEEKITELRKAHNDKKLEEATEILADLLATLKEKHGEDKGVIALLNLDLEEKAAALKSYDEETALLIKKAVLDTDVLAPPEVADAVVRDTTKGREDGRTPLERALFAAQRNLKLARPHTTLQASFFTSKFKDEGMAMSIDQIVSWARAERGGRDHVMLKLLDEQPSGGCFKWGLCESPTLKSSQKTD